jgi:hypothetical protein
VYDRQVDGEPLTLAVSGQLWHESLVIYDVQTHSLWSQLRGEAMMGTLKGTRLRVLPSVLTDWETWRRTRPGSTVAWFDGPTEAFTNEAYDDLGRFVLGIAAGGEAKAWSLAELHRRGPRNYVWDGTPVVAVYDGPSRTARLFGREVEGRTLTFSVEGEVLTDAETGTKWDPVTGKAVAGPLAGRSLVPLPATVSRRDAWRYFYPRSR